MLNWRKQTCHIENAPTSKRVKMRQLDKPTKHNRTYSHKLMYAVCREYSMTQLSDAEKPQSFPPLLHHVYISTGSHIFSIIEPCHNIYSNWNVEEWEKQKKIFIQIYQMCYKRVEISCRWLTAAAREFLCCIRGRKSHRLVEVKEAAVQISLYKC